MFVRIAGGEGEEVTDLTAGDIRDVEGRSPRYEDASRLACWHMH